MELGRPLLLLLEISALTQQKLTSVQLSRSPVASRVANAGVVETLHCRCQRLTSSRGSSCRCAEVQWLAWSDFSHR